MTWLEWAWLSLCILHDASPKVYKIWYFPILILHFKVQESKSVFANNGDTWGILFGRRLRMRPAKKCPSLPQSLEIMSRQLVLEKSAAHQAPLFHGIL